MNPSFKKALYWLKDWWFKLVDSEWNPIKIWKSEIIVKKNDGEDFVWLSDDEIIDIIKRNMYIDINTKDWINKLNDFYSTALWIYNNSRARVVFEKRWWIPIEEFYNYIPFKNKNDVINFLRLTEKKDWRWKTVCLISKVTNAVADTLNTPSLKDLEKESKEILYQIEWPLNINTCSNDEWLCDWIILWKKFILYWIPKKINAIVEKLLWNQDYTTWESIKDWIRYTFEIDSKDNMDKFMLLQHIFYVVKWLWWKIIDFDNKWIPLLNPDIIWSKFREEFIKFLYDNNKNWLKKTSSKWYKEMKIIFELNWNKVEVKITWKWNKNQNWINFQWIYKVLSNDIWWLIIRNSWYINSDEIEIMSKVFFDNLQKFIDENPERKWTPKEVLLKELWDDLQNEWFIYKNIKYENQSKSESKLLLYLVPALAKYYKSILIKWQLKNWEIVYIDDRTLILWIQWYKTEKVERRFKIRNTSSHKRRKSDGKTKV